MAVPGIGLSIAGGPAGRGGTIIARQRLPDGKVALRIRADGPSVPAPAPTEAPTSTATTAPSSSVSPATAVNAPAVARTPDRLAVGERAAVDRLRQRDGQVRQEEQAHAAAAGALAGPISYVYQLGPDGRSYAVGGSVSVNLGKASATPEQGRRAAATLAAAAHAATNPSAADLAAAAQAYSRAGPAPESAGANGTAGKRLDRLA